MTGYSIKDIEKAEVVPGAEPEAEKAVSMEVPRYGVDYHLHSAASHDGEGSVADYCRVAVERNCRELGFANHVDLDPGLPHCDYYDHEAFLLEVDAAREQFPDLRIRAGIEVTHQPGLALRIADYVGGLEVDFVMGSIHIIGPTEHCISEEEGSRKYFGDKISWEDGYAPYFDLLEELVRFGYYDVLGHFDVIKKFGATMLERFDYRHLYGGIRRILEGAIKRDMAIELNSSGLFHDARDFYPCYDILKLYRELGGRRLTLGSDAHIPGNLCKGLDEAAAMARKAGFIELTVFENRVPRQVPLP